MSYAMECFIDEARTPAQRRIANCISAWHRRQDRRMLFAAAYALSVQHVRTSARAGRFVEPEWVVSLLEQWAQYYLITISPEDDDLRLVTPAAWAEAHVAAAAPLTAPWDAVLLGINAHLNNDLPQALADVMRDEWPLSEARLGQRALDLRRMLNAMAGALDALRTSVERLDARLLRGRQRVQVMRSPVNGVQPLAAAWTPSIRGDAVALVTAASTAWAHALREGIECAAARRAHLIMCRIQGGERLLLSPGTRLASDFPHRHESHRCRLGGRAPAWGLQSATTG